MSILRSAIGRTSSHFFPANTRVSRTARSVPFSKKTALPFSHERVNVYLARMMRSASEESWLLMSDFAPSLHERISVNLGFSLDEWHL